MALLCASCLIFGAVLTTHPPALADYRDDIGYTALSSVLGANLPTGAGVPVAQVEAEELALQYAPNTTDPNFAGKNFALRSGVGAASNHATTVGAFSYGLALGIADGATQIEVYSAGGWLGSDFLRYTNSLANPLSSPQVSRVTNHSWLFTLNGSSNNTLDILMRADWVANQDDNLQIAGVNNAATQFGGDNSNPLMMSAMNSITVGRTDGFHSVGSATVGNGTLYATSHNRPDVVVPTSATSWSTPVVSSAAAMLIQASQANPGWSLTQYNSPRTLQVIRGADTSEVIKALILAGADRRVTNTDGTFINDYRAAAANQSTNGLDKRYGAGQLNIRNSYTMQSFGEQNSQQDAVVVADILPAGFDYDQAFGPQGLGGQRTGTYEFNAAWTGQAFTASLAWNVDIDIIRVRQAQYSQAARLYDLNLSLYDITGGGNTLVQSSASTTENSENLATTLVAGRRYRLEVSTPSVTDFSWQYGLAWNGMSNMVWTSAINNVWDVNGTSNWQRGTTANKFLTDDQVVFTDLALLTNVQIAAPVSPGLVTFANATKTYVISGAAITGTTSLIKTDAAVVALQNINSYTGGTTINGGSIRLDVTEALPSGRNVSINAPGTLNLNNFNQTLGGITGNGTIQLGSGNLTVGSNNASAVFSGGIFGTGNLTKLGLGDISLGGMSNYGGTTTINAGQLSVSVNSALGATSGGTVVNNGASLRLINNVNYTTPEPLTLNGEGHSAWGALEVPNGTPTWGGPVTVATNSTIMSNGTLTFSGPVTIQPAIALSKNGGGGLRLTGNINYNAGSLVRMLAGTLELAPAAGSVISLNPALPAYVIGAGTTVRIDGTFNDPLSDDVNPALAAELLSASANLQILAGNIRSSRIFGTGTVTVNPGATLTAGYVRQNGLNLQSGARLTIPVNGGAGGLSVLNNTAAGTPALTMTGSSFWDLNDNDAIIYYSGGTADPNPLPTITSYVNNFFNNTPGVPRIGSSSLTDSGGARILIAVDNMQTQFGNVGNPFYDQTLGNSNLGTGFNQVILRYTYPGDYNLDGKVDGADYLVVDTNLGSQTAGGMAGYILGDGDFNGVVEPADYLFIDSFIGSGVANPLGGGLAEEGFARPLAITAIPEPSAWIAFFTAGTLGWGALVGRKLRQWMIRRA
ncbi:MAG: hypothetical protein SFX18_01300 [Pirellulales bacterium]|nr:hypothetical protein [Pirellulales bacterium]